MSELSQTGERGRELTAEEWKKVDELVDEMGWSYYKARLALGLEPPSGQNVSADEKPRPRRRSDLAAFDTRTGDAMLAYASEQEPSDDKWGEISRRGAAMARAALRSA
jgi:hypothetical protein